MPRPFGPTDRVGLKFRTNVRSFLLIKVTPTELSAELIADRVDNVKARLNWLVSQLNRAGGCHMQLHQQRVTLKHISLTGGNGRMYVVPTADAFDVVLSGASLTQELSPFMTELTGKPCTNYKQRNSKKHQRREPFWRLADFALVEIAVTQYSKTQPTSGKKAIRT